jgi:hypothetical protein
VALVAVAAHAISLGGDLLPYDDDTFVLRNPLFGEGPLLERLAAVLTRPYYAAYHPLHLLSYWIDRALLRDVPAGGHLLNVCLFALGAVLLFLFLERLLPPGRTAFYAALLYAAHPIHVESVAWLSSRKDVLCLLFGTGGMLAYSRGRPWLGQGLLVAAMLSKIIAAALPLFLVAAEALLPAQPGLAPRLGRSLRRLAPALLAAVILGLAAVRAEHGAEAIRDVPWAAHGMVGALGWYLRRLVFPYPLSARYEFGPMTSLADPRVSLSALLLAALTALAIRAYVRRRATLPALCLSWFLLGVAPVSNVFPLAQFVADRYLLLASIGFALGAGAAFATLERLLPRVAPALLLLTVGALTGGSATRSLVWESELSLWADAARKAPRDPATRLNYGSALGSCGDLDGAEREFRAALALRPGLGPAERNLARVRARRARTAAGSRPATGSRIRPTTEAGCAGP